MNFLDDRNAFPPEDIDGVWQRFILLAQLKKLSTSKHDKKDKERLLIQTFWVQLSNFDNVFALTEVFRYYAQM